MASGRTAFIGRRPTRFCGWRRRLDVSQQPHACPAVHLQAVGHHGPADRRGGRNHRAGRPADPLRPDPGRVSRPREARAAERLRDHRERSPPPSPRTALRSRWPARVPAVRPHRSVGETSHVRRDTAGTDCQCGAGTLAVDGNSAVVVAGRDRIVVCCGPTRRYRMPRHFSVRPTELKPRPTR